MEHNTAKQIIILINDKKKKHVSTIKIIFELNNVLIVSF